MSDEADNSGSLDGREHAGRSLHEFTADDQFAHGILEFYHKDDAPAQGARVRRVMDAIAHEHLVAAQAKDAARAASHPRTSRALRAPGRKPAWRVMASLASMAAVLGITFGLAVFSASTESPAQATLRSAVAAMRSEGERRFEVRAMLAGASEVSSEPLATVDTRAGANISNMVMRVRTPEGNFFVTGRDDEGEWAITQTGEPRRLQGPRPNPGWLQMGDASLLVEPVDTLLERLSTRYTLERREGAVMVGREGEWTLIEGRRKAGDVPLADRVAIWINPATKLVERMEMRWGGERGGKAGGDAKTGTLEDGAAAPGEFGDGMGPEGRPGPRGPRGWDGEGHRRPLGPPDDPLGLGPRGEGRGGPEHREDRRPEEAAPPERGPEGEPGAGRGDGPRRGDGLGPRRGEGRGPEGRGPEGRGPEGRGGPEGRPGGRRHGFEGPFGPGMRPRFGPGGPRPMDRPPRFGEPGQPRPPKVIVFDLVACDPFPEGWFSPGAHTASADVKDDGAKVEEGR